MPDKSSAGDCVVMKRSVPVTTFVLCSARSRYITLSAGSLVTEAPDFTNMAA